MININKYKIRQYKDNNFNFNRIKDLYDRAMINKATHIINHYFQKILINKPIYNISHDKIIIYIFYYMPVKSKYKSNIVKLNDLNDIKQILINKCFYNHKLEIKFIKLHYPYLDSYILSKYIALNSMKYTFNRLKRKLFKRIILTKPTINNNNDNKSFLTGVKINISGRLASHRIRPRTNKYVTNSGSFKYNSSQSIIDYGVYTDKNNSGSYTIKIWLSEKYPLYNDIYI